MLNIMITSMLSGRTDDEGKHESPYRELRAPNLNSNDTKREHGHYMRY
jgi:hypothetical protein